MAKKQKREGRGCKDGVTVRGNVGCPGCALNRVPSLGAAYLEARVR